MSIRSPTVSEPRAVATGSTADVEDSAQRFLDPVATARGSDTIASDTLVDRQGLMHQAFLLSRVNRVAPRRGAR